MKKLSFLFLLLVSLSTSAQTTTSLFEAANALYKDGKFDKALERYQQIEQQDQVSSALYFNMANCYYKLNKVGPTIYYYEKALLLDPLNEDAKNNLAFAKLLTIDAIEALPESVFQKLDRSVIKKLSYGQWAWLSIGSAFLVSLFFLLFHFSYTPSKKRVFFVLSGLSLVFFIVSLSLSFKEYNYSKTTVFGIIYAEKTNVKNAPTLNSEDVFTLHEGTKVTVLDSVDNWKKIKLSDGNIGWVIGEELKLLRLY